MAKGSTALKNNTGRSHSGSSGRKTGSPARSAGSRKTSSGQGRRSSGGKTAGSSGRRASAETRETGGSVSSSGIVREVVLCVVLALSVLILLANFGIVGRFGNTMSDALFGTFGLMAHVFPFAVFFGSAFFIANIENPLIARKAIGFIIMFVFLTAFLQLLTIGYAKNAAVSEIYRYCREERTGGGAVGGAIVHVFGYAFGTVGAYILTIFGLIAGAIVMTQKPLISGIGARGRDAAERARKRRNIHRLERAEEKDSQKKEQEALRKLHRTEEQLERDRRIREIELETARKEREMSRSRTAERVPGRLSYSDPMIEADGNPLDAVTLERQNASSGDYTATMDSARNPIRIGDDPFMGTAPKTAGAFGGGNDLPEEEEASFEMPSFLRDVGEPSVEEPAGSSGQPSGDPVPDTVPRQEGVSAAESAAEPAGKKTARKKSAAASGDKAESAGPKEDAQTGADSIRKQIGEEAPAGKVYRLPPIDLLRKGKSGAAESDRTIRDTAVKLQETLRDFGVNVKVVNVSRGPTVTRYELQPEHGVKVSRIINLQDDIKLNLAAADIRIEAPIPGKAAVGIEVPNKSASTVMLRELIESAEFKKDRGVLTFAVGKDLGGRTIVTDIEKMPHLLIAGTTGSGKSVCINTLIMSILYKSTPDQVKMLMIDPKVVELKIYDGIPHLLIPVVTDAKKAAGALNWAVQEMTERYNKFASYPGVRDIKSYNARVDKLNAGVEPSEKIPKMPRIVVIVDELADLMMVASSEVEDAVCRLAQLARAAGIHLIIATQRPSVNVVTGLIKANMPSRIALAVNSGIDSRTILDMNGAEKLLGRGDMLFYPQGYPKPVRVQGAFVSDDEISDVVRFLSSQTEEDDYSREVEVMIESSAGGIQGAQGGDDERDEYFAESGRLIIEKDKASIGMLQRAFKIGFNRAARIMDQLSDAGVVGGEEGTKPRKILMTAEEFENLLNGGTAEIP